jgi:hypothetical protein
MVRLPLSKSLMQSRSRRRSPADESAVYVTTAVTRCECECGGFRLPPHIKALGIYILQATYDIRPNLVADEQK